MLNLESNPADQQPVLVAIDNLQFAFRDFANALGGNPVGTNAEITAALLGDNPKWENGMVNYSLFNDGFN